MTQSVPAATDGVYGISVAAELAGVGPQTLRLYERRGLLTPARTSGGTRRHSQHNPRRVRWIRELVQAGVKLTGITQILKLETSTAELRASTSRPRPGRRYLATPETPAPCDPDVLQAPRGWE